MTSFTITGTDSANHTLLAGEVGHTGRNAILTGLVTVSGGDLVNFGMISYVGGTQGLIVSDSYSAVTNFGTVLGDGIGLYSSFSDYVQVINYGTISGRASGSSGMLMNGAGSQVVNYGTISGLDDIGLNLANVGATSAAHSVSNSGTIRGTTGIYSIADSVTITNTGWIIGLNDEAIYLNGADATTIVNTGGHIRGAIEATAFGDSLDNRGGEILGNVFANAGDDTFLNLRGSISGDVDLGAGNDVLDNRDGRVEGGVNGDTGNDSVDNRRGTITGAVDLGEGNDVLDNRGGLVDGGILGGLGNDQLIASATAADIFDGGDGVDVADYRYGSAVVVALDGTLDNSLAAVNDEFLNVEQVYGSRTGADSIRGNASANLLRGEGGADTVDGAAGNDVLNGGRGIDALAGGTGNDTFQFSSLDHIGDVISDFSATATDDDRFQISSSAFGGGLVAGVLAANLFRSRADNLAQDADDRFIFRTTDRTLWFDADGTGLELALMVADLQSGAVVAAADIVLY